MDELDHVPMEEDIREDGGAENPQAQAPSLDIVPVKKRVVRNPIPKLNPERIMGPKGLPRLQESFSEFRFKGSEATDLEVLMRRFEHWAHVLFPQRPFMDVMNRISDLGKKREIQVNLNRLRMGYKTTFTSRLDGDDDEVQGDENSIQREEERIVDEDDEFQRLIREAEARDDEMEACHAQEDEIVTLVNQEKERVSDVENDPFIADDLLRKYDESSDEESPAINASKNKSKDQNPSPNSNPSQAKEDSDEERTSKPKRAANVLDSSSDEE